MREPSKILSAKEAKVSVLQTKIAAQEKVVAKEQAKLDKLLAKVK